MIKSLITSGDIATPIIALTFLEIAVLCSFRRLSLASILPNILAGDFLLLAWRFSTTHWLWSAASLLGALLAHSTDMLRRHATK